MDEPRSESARRRDLAWVAFAYVVAIAAGGVTAWLLRARAPWIAVLAADVVGTVVIFGFSRAFDNSSLYDAYWSVAPMAIAGGLFAFGHEPGVSHVRRTLVLVLVMAWGARLTWNWVRGWTGMGHEDWRYVDLRKQTGSLYWPASFFGLHLFPTVVTYLGGLAMFPAMIYGKDRLSIVDFAALFVMGGGALLEATADAQLRKFRLSNTTPGRIMADGLWSLCRHPNYLGEMLFWWGLFLFGFAADATSWRFVVGPLAVTGLIAGVSVRMIDKRSVERRPDYAAHMKRLPAFLPRIW